MKLKSRKQSFVFQQDFAPAHTAKQTVKLLNDFGLKFWNKNTWPSNSPDLNPLDYYFWSRIQTIACKKHHNNLNSLKMSIKRAINTLEKEEIIHGLSKFRNRIEAVINASGGYIE